MKRARIKVYPSGGTEGTLALLQGTMHAEGRAHVTPAEASALEEAQVWPQGEGGWVFVGADGALWAGGDAGLIAKVRGKGGRRLSCSRPKLPADQKARTYSIQLRRPEREKLEALAQAETEKTGRRVSVSAVVERLVRHA